MKVLLGTTSDDFAARLKKASSSDIRVASYLNQNLKEIDWTLNSLHHNVQSVAVLFGFNVPKYNYQNVKLFIEDILDWKPDLVISDNEPFVVYLAKVLDIELWSCSSLNLLNGIQWRNKNITHLMDKYIVKNASRNLIYSPFVDLYGFPEIKKEYDWVRPYYQYPTKINTNLNKASNLYKYLENKVLQLENINWNDGQTSFIADSFYSLYNILVTPQKKNQEHILNARICEEFNIGCNLGHLEGVDLFYVQKLYSKFEGRENSEIALNLRVINELHEEFD